MASPTLPTPQARSARRSYEMIPIANLVRFARDRSMLAVENFNCGRPARLDNMLSNDAFRSFVILNPASAAGAAGRRWDQIAKLLRSSLGAFEYAATQKPGEATALASAALREGFEMVVSVGGDGTLNEVVGGFFDGSVSIAP